MRRIRHAFARDLADRAAHDTRQQAAMLASVLFAGVAGPSLLLIWLLPDVVSHRVAYAGAGVCIIAAIVVPRLPWDRWPSGALAALPALGLLLLLISGGILDDSLEYYGVFSPLIFLFVGWVFSSAGVLRFAAVTLAAFTVTVGLGQETYEVAPYFLLGLGASVACGAVVAYGRRTEARTIDAMGELMAAAGLLGSARSDDEVASIVSGSMRRLVSARDVSLVTSAACATPPGAGDVAVPVLSAEGERIAAIVAALDDEAAVLDPLSARMAELLAAETGRALDRIRATAQLTALSRTDPLTRLGNRLELAEALHRMRPGDCVVLCDLDHFKTVNETVGHAGGDLALAAFAEALREVVRDTDTAVRYGGEEFLMVLSSTTTEGGLAVLQRLRERWVARQPVTTFSSGVAVHASPSTAQETLERADRALYRAKAAGRVRDVVDGPVGREFRAVWR